VEVVATLALDTENAVHELRVLLADLRFGFLAHSVEPVGETVDEFWPFPCSESTRGAERWEEHFSPHQ
jgi:hypothetical protein